MSITGVETPGVFDEPGRDEAAAAGRASLDAALQRVSLEQRDAFWNAIGLYYATRRHPGGDESPIRAAVLPAA